MRGVVERYETVLYGISGARTRTAVGRTWMIIMSGNDFHGEAGFSVPASSVVGLTKGDLS